MTPRQIAANIKNQYFYNAARHAYKKSGAKNFFYDKNKFDEFVEKYKHIEVKSHWDYSEEAQEKTAKERVQKLLSINKNIKPTSVCEIGPGSGKLLKQFADLGCLEVYGIDIQKPANLDPRITYFTDGVHEMNHIEDNSIEFMYSIDAFEHIPDPIAGIKKCIQKLKPDGLLYLQIGGNFSPWGSHYYHIIKIPYLNILFPQEYLTEYAKSVNKKYPWINKTPAHQYIEYFESLSYEAELLSLKYTHVWYYSRFMKKHMEVFKAKTIPRFEDYYVEEIFALVKKSNSLDYLR